MRNLSPDMITELSSDSIEPALLAEMYFDSGNVFVWTGVGELVWGDKTYTGLGNLCGVSPIEETQDLKAKGIVVTLNGIATSNVSLALGERCRGRPFRMYLAILNHNQHIELEDGSGDILTEDGGYILQENELISSPQRIFAGFMNTMELTINSQTSDIRLTVESALIVGQRQKLRRYTDEDQKAIYPMDKGLSLINQLMDKELVW